MDTLARALAKREPRPSPSETEHSEALGIVAEHGNKLTGYLALLIQSASAA